MSLTTSTPQKYSLKTVEIISFFLTSLLGVLFHFVYEWSGMQPFVGFFFPINESTWEHLKLIFFPILLVSILEYFIGEIRHPDFICIKLRSTLLGMLATVVLFYTYSGVLGAVIDWINIAIYFVAVALAYLYSYSRLQADTTILCNPHLSLLLIFTITVLFMVFTVYPPYLGLFRAP